ncbi:MAG: hypothetical protein LZF60_20030 [Nitrospira sp.]|nr:MAG: hypothetical protein LZF60_20030 [Nitrospira sp.]
MIRQRFAGTYEITVIPALPRRLADWPRSLRVPTVYRRTALLEYRPGGMRWFWTQADACSQTEIRQTEESTGQSASVSKGAVSTMPSRADPRRAVCDSLRRTSQRQVAPYSSWVFVCPGGTCFTTGG